MLQHAKAHNTTSIKDTALLVDQIVDHVGTIILGKEHQIRLALACLIARGHLLIEDLPGVGKTTLTHTLAHILGLRFQRIQFTSDMLPADITGVSIFNQASGTFRFHQGPVFAEVVLADEVNRATPKAQSALLEAMEEHQVTVDGKTYPLPDPFFVIATQNPTQQIGTFPLPESQLDRFMVCLSMGYPDPQAEKSLLMGKNRRNLIAEQAPMLGPDMLATFQHQASEIHSSEPLIDYIQAILTYTRDAPEFRNGLSPRAGLALLHCAQAWALMEGRDHAIPDDIQVILPGIVRHRLLAGEQGQSLDGDEMIDLVLRVSIP